MFKYHKYICRIRNLQYSRIYLCLIVIRVKTIYRGDSQRGQFTYLEVSSCSSYNPLIKTMTNTSALRGLQYRWHYM